MKEEKHKLGNTNVIVYIPEISEEERNRLKEITLSIAERMYMKQLQEEQK